MENKPAEGNFHPARRKLWLLIQRWASLDFWPYKPIKGVQFVTSADMSGKQLIYAHFQILMKTAIRSTDTDKSCSHTSFATDTLTCNVLKVLPKTGLPSILRHPALRSCRLAA